MTVLALRLGGPLQSWGSSGRFRASSLSSLPGAQKIFLE